MRPVELEVQQTLSRSVELTGTGLHSGKKVRVVLWPAEAGHGIRFRRVDMAGAPEIHVVPQSLESGLRCTALRQDSARVRTVEHLLAVCYGLGIDNLRIDLDAEELPILDGSAGPWLEAVDDAGLRALDAPCRFIEVSRPVLWSAEQTHILALPSPAFRLSVASVTGHAVAGDQVIDLVVTPQAFRQSLATARTFCFMEEVEALLASGLAQGGSLENAIVVTADGYSSPLRMDNELAAHKALDLLGDLATLGARLHAHVVAVRPGHHSNQQLVRSLWSQYDEPARASDEGVGRCFIRA